MEEHLTPEQIQDAVYSRTTISEIANTESHMRSCSTCRNRYMEDLGLAVRTLSWITESIAITNFKTAFDTEALATNNLPVRAILCLDESTISTLPDARTVWHLQDGTNPPGLFSEAVRKLERLLAIHDRVLVHCRAGQSRSAAVVAGYLVCNGGMRVDEAIQYVTSKRPITKIMPGLLHHIHELEMRD